MSFGQLTGVKFIGNSAGDHYTTISQAMAALGSQGVGVGGVTFKIRSGTYNERVEIPLAPGASSANPVIIESLAGHADSVRIVSAGLAQTYRYNTIRMMYCVYTTLRKVTAIYTNDTRGEALNLDGDSYNAPVAYNTVEECVFIAPYVSDDKVACIKFEGSFENSRVFNNVVRKNTTIGGNIGINAALNRWNSGNIVENNNVRDFYGMGIRTEELHHKIWGNTIINQRKNVDRNQVYGIYVVWDDGSMFVNNMVSLDATGTKECYGFISEFSTGSRFQFNSIHIYGEGRTTAPIRIKTQLIYGEFLGIFNNNMLSNEAGGPAFLWAESSTSAAKTIVLDYNNYYTTGPVLAVYQGVSCANLQELRQASLQDGGSHSQVPGFISALDLHTFNPLLNNRGTMVQDITRDIDGDTRTGPDIGADEYTTFTTDIGISDIFFPSPKSGAKNALSVLIRNNGTASQQGKKFKLQYSIDQGQNWTEPQEFTAANLTSYTDPEIFTFKDSALITQGGKIPVCVKLSTPPTGDQYTGNDNLCTSVCFPMKGVFKVGPGEPVYRTLSDVADILHCAGVEGPVTFELAPGTYQEQIRLSAYPGMHSNRPVVILGRSDTLGNKPHLFINAGGAADLNHSVIRFSGARHVTLENVKVSNKRTGNYASAIHIVGASDSIVLQNNIIGFDSNTSANTACILGSSETSFFGSKGFKKLEVNNNQLEFGYYGIALKGDLHNQGGLENTVIKNNIIRKTIIGIDAEDIQNIQVHGNQILFKPATSQSRGIDLEDIKGRFSISGNLVHNNEEEGITIRYAQPTDSGLITNNMVIGRGQGLYTYWFNDNILIDHNTFVSWNKESARIGANSSQTGNFHYFRNNILVNYSTNNPALHIFQPSAVNKTDYNQFFATGPNLIRIGTTSYATLDAYKTANSGMDVNSIQLKPDLVRDSLTNPNLHIKKNGSFFIVPNLAHVPTDFDGDFRWAGGAMAGADEWVRYDLAVNSVRVNKSGADSFFIRPLLQNLGAGVSEQTVELQWSVNGGQSWEGKQKFPLSKLSSYGSFQEEVFALPYVGPSTPEQVCVRIVAPGIPDDLNPANNQICQKVCNIDSIRSIPIGASRALKDLGQAMSQVHLELNGGCVLNGPLVFEIDPGMYDQRVVVTPFKGAWQGTPVTVLGMGEKPDQVRLTFKGTEANPSTVDVDGTQWLRIKNLSIENSGTGVGTGLRIGNGVSQISLDKVHVTVDSNSLSDNVHAIRLGNWDSTKLGAINRHIFMDSLLLKGGFAGLWATQGSNLDGPENVQFIRSRIKDFYGSGIQVENLKDLLVADMVLTGRPGNAFSQGMTLSRIKGRLDIQKNQVSGYGGVGVFISLCNLGQGSMVANNFIGGNLSSSGGGFGLLVSNTSNLNIFHNSIHIDHKDIAQGAALQVELSNNVRVVNNLGVHRGKGYAYSVLGGAGVLESDHNAWFSNGTYLAFWEMQQATLQDLRDASFKEVKSLVHDPSFASASDLHVFEPALDNKGKYLPLVPSDIDGQKRDTLTCDIGADEFSVGLDGAGLELLSPVGSGHNPGEAKSVRMRYANVGNVSFSGFDLVYWINGLEMAREPQPGSVTVGEVKEYTFIGKWTPMSDGDYKVCVGIDVDSDIDPKNDTICRNVKVGSIGLMAAELNINGGCRIYPVPVQSANAVLYCTNGFNASVVLDMQGRVVMDLSGSGDRITLLDLNGLAPGMYRLLSQRAGQWTSSPFGKQ